MSIDTHDVNDLLDRIAQLEQRLDKLESEQEAEVSTAGHRDSAVLERLEAGEAVTVREFQSLYRRHTDMVNSSKIADRIRGLVSRPEFEQCGRQVWQYAPEERQCPALEDGRCRE